MLWFKHDTTASTDAKLKKLILRFGPEGYAIYFHCIELIAGDVTNDNITFCLEHDAEVIAHNLNFQSDNDITAVDKVNLIMLYIIELGLFEVDSDKIFCFKLAKRLDSSLIKNPELKKIKNSYKKNEKKRDLPRNNNADKKRIENKRKKQSKTHENDLEFLELFKLYPRKTAIKTCYTQYKKLIKNGVNYNDLISATKNYSKEMINKEIEFIKLGSTFFGKDDHWKEFIQEQKADKIYRGPKRPEQKFGGEL